MRPCSAGIVEHFARTLTPRGRRAPHRVDRRRIADVAGRDKRTYAAWRCVMGGLWTEQKLLKPGAAEHTNLRRCNHRRRFLEAS